LNTALTPKQVKFCAEYLKDFNGTQAAIRAGYSKRTANEQASRLLANVNIQKHLTPKKVKLMEKAEITQERVMQEIGRLALSNVKRLYNEDGTLKAVHELDDEVAATIASVELDEVYHGKKVFVKSKKVKMWNKEKALEMLAKHFGIYEDPSTTLNLNVSIKRKNRNANG
jgi:phage terminase small subunit